MKLLTASRLGILVICALLLLTSSACMAKVIYVKTDGNDANDGLSWETAKKTVAAGIAASISGDDIWVAAGTYVERVQLKPGISLYGGFAGTETLRDQRNYASNVTALDGSSQDSVVKMNTISTVAARVDGFTVRNGGTTNSDGAAFRCNFCPVNIANCTMTNCTGRYGGAVYCTIACSITDCTITSCTATYGGAIYVSGSTCTISNCTISNNRCVSGKGGGIYLGSTTASVTGNQIAGNSASCGGGIYCTGSPTISGNTITGNSIGAIAMSSGSPQVLNNTITGNSAPDQYGYSVVYCPVVSATITGNTISRNVGIGIKGSGNTTTKQRITGNTISMNTLGGIYSDGYMSIGNNLISGNQGRGGIFCGSYTDIYNNVIKANSAKDDGGGVYCNGTSITVTNNTIIGNNGVNGAGIWTCGADTVPTVLKNNIVAFCSSGIFKSTGVGDVSTAITQCNCVYGNRDYNYSVLPDPTGTNGNISQDPKLASPKYGNAHIQPDSPCKDKGDDTAIQTGWTDTDGQARKQGLHVDIGADESNGTTWTDGPYVVMHVAPEGSDTNDGGSWLTAKKTIQAAIDAAAVQGGDVQVGAGTYLERIVLHPYAYVYGGYRSDNGSRDWKTNLTVIDGQQGGAAVTALSGHACGAIDGFAVRNGNTGISCYGGGPTVSNNLVTGNAGKYAVECVYASPTVTDNTISDNSGCGVYCEATTALVKGNVIRANKDGGISVGLPKAAPTIMSNMISGNTITSVGASGIRLTANSHALIAGNVITACQGAISATYSDYSTIANNTIVGNGEDYNGAVYCSASSTTFANNIIAFNSNGLVFQGYSGSERPVLYNNCIYGNGAANYTGTAPGTGDISLDPMLTGVQFGDVHLQPGSPCINAGDNGVVCADWMDIDGQDRILPAGGRVDIGADEWDGSTVWPTGPHTIIRVSPTGDDANDGSAWDDAHSKRTVTAAVTAAGALGGEVWVKAGTYNECIVLPPFVHLYGGFAGNEVDKSQSDPRVSVTALDGQQLGTVVTMPQGFMLSTVDGITIRNGSGNGISSYGTATVTRNTVANNKSGGISSRISSVVTDNIVSNNGGTGIYCITGTILRNRITGNSGRGIAVSSGLSNLSTISGNTISGNLGGGISCTGAMYGATVLITDNTITNNTGSGSSGPKGGGVYCYVTRGTISGNTISGNSCLGQGGGVYLEQSSLTVSSNTISGNRADYYGGGVYCYVSNTGWAPSLITNNVISDNTGAKNGGGVYCVSYVAPRVVNNTIIGNNSLDGGGVYCLESPALVKNNIVAFNQSGVGHRSTQGYKLDLGSNCVYGNTEYDYSIGLLPGTDDISGDPLFVDRANEKYHLTASSPCIDKGLNTAIGLPTFDFEGEGRIFGGTVDIGADEWWSSVFSATEIKGAPEGALVKVGATPVSADWAGAFYVENEERTGGIRVEMAGHPAVEDDMVSFTGKVKTSPLGERFVAADAVTPGQGTFDVKPFGMANRMLGGGPAGLQDGVWSKRFVQIPGDGYTLDWVQASTLNNIGLLVTTFGNVTYAGDGFFYLDDGSALDDGSGHKGVKVLATGLNFPSEGFVKVTGISSCEKNGDRLVRLLRVRKQEDIQP